jgi:sugar O-acyltransferase (sialic acid O-acetyltransferase NeuD family)
MNKIKKVIIFGTGGNCIDILDTIHVINRNHSEQYECVGFLDDHPEQWGKSIMGVKVHGPLHKAKEFPADIFFVNGIGSSSNFWRKEDIINQSSIDISRFETIVHPTAFISDLACIGRGVVVFQNVTITSNVQIGNHVIILPNSVISHDDIIGDYSCITGGVCISGGVTVGKACYLGSNCTIRENIKIGDYSLIGMGSTVLHHVQENSVMAGNPARFIRSVRQK